MSQRATDIHRHAVAACLQIESAAGALLASEDRHQLVAPPLWHALHLAAALAPAASPAHAATATALRDVMHAIVDARTDAYVALPYVASAAAALAAQWSAPNAAHSLNAVTYELATLLPVAAKSPTASAAPTTQPHAGKLMFRATPLVVPAPTTAEQLARDLLA